MFSAVVFCCRPGSQGRYQASGKGAAAGKAVSPRRKILLFPKKASSVWRKRPFFGGEPGKAGMFFRCGVSGLAAYAYRAKRFQPCAPGSGEKRQCLRQIRAAAGGQLCRDYEVMLVSRTAAGFSPISSSTIVCVCPGTLSSSRRSCS